MPSRWDCCIRSRILDAIAGVRGPAFARLCCDVFLQLLPWGLVCGSLVNCVIWHQG